MPPNAIVEKQSTLQFSCGGLQAGGRFVAVGTNCLEHDKFVCRVVLALPLSIVNEDDLSRWMEVS